MYKIIAAISMFIRQFYLSNPFEALGEGLRVEINNVSVVLSPSLLNWLAESLMWGITYGVVGMYYEKGSAPALGSFLYLIFYCVHTWLIHLMAFADFNKWIVILILVLYVGCHAGINILRNRWFYR
ncbi:MAG: hypothetical protein IJW37_10100 [Lachnospiraceae bacterium]|nr:hypothetical protein [Lachnospiraceae bacterium]